MFFLAMAVLEPPAGMAPVMTAMIVTFGVAVLMMRRQLLLHAPGVNRAPRHARAAAANTIVVDAVCEMAPRKELSTGR